MGHKVCGQNLSSSFVTADSNGNIIISGQFNCIAEFFNCNIMAPILSVCSENTCCSSYIAKYNALGQIYWVTKQENISSIPIVKTDYLNNILVTGLYNSCQMDIYNNNDTIGKILKNKSADSLKNNTISQNMSIFHKFWNCQNQKKDKKKF